MLFILLNEIPLTQFDFGQLIPQFLEFVIRFVKVVVGFKLERSGFSSGSWSSLEVLPLTTLALLMLVPRPVPPVAALLMLALRVLPHLVTRTLVLLVLVVHALATLLVRLETEIALD